MPTDNYAKTTPRLVKLGQQGAAAVSAYYYFRSKTKKTDVADLGQIHLTSSTTLPTDAPIILATTQPRPYEMIHKDGAPSSFASFDAVSDAKKKGWKVKEVGTFQGQYGNGASPSFDSATKSLMVFVPIPWGDSDSSEKIKYGWLIPAWQAKKIGETDRAALGIKFPSDTDWKDLVVGGGGGPGKNKRGPLPPKAQKTGSDSTTGQYTTTTFFDPTQNLPAIWSQVSGRIPLQIALE